jgi:Na+/proline symporter
VVVIFAAALAALMSTADSALLSISSMFTRDVYQAHFRPHSSQAELTRVGKWSSWVVVAVLVVIAIGTEKTLVRLLELKFEVLIQVVPCFFLGLYWERLSSRVVLAGMLTGLAVALGLTAMGMPRVAGFHAGVVGLGLNFAVCAVGTLLTPAPDQMQGERGA